MRSYQYGGVSYANPHAATQIGNGLSTTSYAYDNNGNLTSAGNGTATTTYSYDYANRLIGLFVFSLAVQQLHTGMMPSARACIRSSRQHRQARIRSNSSPSRRRRNRQLTGQRRLSTFSTGIPYSPQSISNSRMELRLELQRLDMCTPFISAPPMW